jgi:hypothetical protein
MILLDDPMIVLMGITYYNNEPRDVANVLVPVPVLVLVLVLVLVQGFDAYFFDFMNCFRKIQSLSFLVCDDVLKSMKVIKVTSKVVRLSA